MSAPSVIVFDVNETLSDMAPLAGRFEAIGAPRHLAPLWFSHLLRDGFALTAAGDRAGFAEIGTAMLHEVLHGLPLTTDREQGVRYVMEGFGQLLVHPDVPPGVRALRARGFRLVTLSNGAAEVARGLLDRSGITPEFEQLLSVEDAAAWKPARSAYEYAAGQCGVQPEEMMLVAVHPWDIHGAARAGLGTGWINRDGGRWPGYFHAPEVTAGSMEELAEALRGAGDHPHHP